MMLSGIAAELFLKKSESGLADADAAVVGGDLLVDQDANLRMALEFIQKRFEQQFVLKDAS